MLRNLNMKPLVEAARRGAFFSRCGMVCLLWMIFFSGCTVITDFDESRIKLNLHEVLMNEFIQIGTIADVGTITLHFSKPFSEDDIDELYELFGNEITMDLAVDGVSTGSQITVNQVADTPKHPGEFQLTVGSGGRNALIVFYNGVPDDRIVQPGDAVVLVIHVAENSLIATDAYAYDTTVNIDQ